MRLVGVGVVAYTCYTSATSGGVDVSQQTSGSGQGHVDHQTRLEHCQVFKKFMTLSLRGKTFFLTLCHLPLIFLTLLYISYFVKFPLWTLFTQFLFFNQIAVTGHKNEIFLDFEYD